VQTKKLFHFEFASGVEHSKHIFWWSLIYCVRI